MSNAAKSDCTPVHRTKIPALLAVAALTLAGCSSDAGSLQPGNSGSDKLANFLAFNTTSPPPIVQKVEEIKVDCPTVEVQDGTAAARYYAGARTSDRVRYQFSVIDVARECNVSNGKIFIKVGVAGRALLGPAGSAGTFSAPVRIAIRKDSTQGGATLVSKTYTASATLQSDGSDAAFSVVSEALEVPFIREAADQDYTILVGFDTGAKVSTSVRHKRRRA